MKNHICLLLLVAMLASLSACGGADTPADTTAASAETTTPTTESPFEPDDLPADLDFGGKEVNIFIGDYNSAYATDIIAEEETGARLSDAIYRTQLNVEDRLNVKIDYASEAYVWEEVSAFNAKFIAGIMAGDAGKDIFYSMDNYSSYLADGNYFHNLADMKYINLDKPWYNQTVRDNIIGDYIHFVSGRFAIANVKNALALYFNDDLYKSLGKKDDLYALVDSGKWTHAKMKEILKDTYADINGNTERDAADQYGLTYGDPNKYLGYLKAFGMDIFVKEGKEYKFAYDNERAVSAVEELVNYINGNESVLPAVAGKDNPDHAISSGGGNYASKLFMEGRAVFSASLIADAATIVPEIDFGYGLLPFPKWDESQKDYATMLQRNCFMLIPVTVEDTDMVSAVMEALASESYRSLLPEYCEVTLKTRYSQDDNVSRMFDLIGGSIVFDPGEIYAGVLGTPSGDIKARISANDPNWASFIAGKKDSLIEKMNSIIK